MSAAVLPSSYSMADMERMANALAKSGLFGMKSTDQALALMLLAQAEGRHPITAARDYDIIDGRPAKKAEAMLRDFLTAGGGVEWLELSDTVCRASFSHQSGGLATIEWTVQRARQAGIAGDMWVRYPRQMLRCRVISEGVRTVWPMATSGLYVDEEVRDFAPTPASPTATQRSSAQGQEGEATSASRSAPADNAPTSPAFFPAAARHRDGPVHRKSSRQLKAAGEDQRIQAEIDDCDLAGLAQWEAEFSGRTGHLPRSWLDPIRDMIALRREEVLLAAACAEMDAAYAAAAA